MKAQEEHNQQVMLINWCNLNKKVAPCLEFIYAIPNAGQRHPAVGAKMKAEGLKAGMWDLCLPFPKLTSPKVSEEYAPIYLKCGLYMEMKWGKNQLTKPRDGKLGQTCWKTWFIKNGYVVRVAHSADIGIAQLKYYINPEETRWIDFQ